MIACSCFAALAAGGAFAGEPAWNVGNGFKGFSHAENCVAEVTPEGLRCSAIEYDMQLYFDTMFSVEGLEKIVYTYKAEGTGNRGGELFYSLEADGRFRERSRFRLPAPVADGQWHSVTVAVSSVSDPENWKAGGFMSAFRFDPTNAKGGTLLVRELRFIGEVDETVFTADQRKYALDGDPFPRVKPECWPAEEPTRPPRDRSNPQRGLGGLAFPDNATAGSPVRFAYDFAGKEPAGAITGELVFRDENSRVRWRERVRLGCEARVPSAGGRWRLNVPCTLPRYVGTCRLSVALDSPDVFVASGRLPVAEIAVKRAAVDPAFPKPHVAKVVKVGGWPQMSVDGKPFFAFWAGVSNSRPDRTRRHSDAPINLVTVYNNVSDWWPREGVFDPSYFDYAAELYGREYPDAYFMYNLSIYPPTDWCAKHPDEMCQDEQGNVIKDGRPSFSLASKRAIDDMAAVMEKAIAYLETSPYANRIIGYRINSGHTIEWLGWDPPNSRTTLDFSPAAQKGFAAWAKEFYPALADVTVPTLAERSALDDGAFIWEPAKHLKTVAYHDFLSTVTAEDLIRLCRRAKELVGGRKLVGTYYGYVMTLWSGGREQIRSHYSLKKVLDSGAVDYLMSPQPYSIRNLGDPVGDMKPFRSLAENGILPVIEDDTRTHNGRYLRVSGNYQTLTEEASIAVTRRNLATALCRNEVPYFYALCLGTEFDFPVWARDATAAKRAGERCLEKAARRNAEIAIVVSEETIKAMPMLIAKGTGTLSGEFRQRYLKDGTVAVDGTGGIALAADPFCYALIRWSRVGAPVDYVLAEDLKDHPGDYKLYVFENSYRADAAFARTVERLRTRPCTLAWLSAPGYMGADGNSTAAMKALTGLDFVKLADAAQASVTMKADGRRMGPPNFKMKPLFAVTGADEVLGTYADGSAGVAAVKTGKATTVFCGPYQTDLKFLRDLAQRAGVHLYTDSLDPVEANERLFTLHARFAGKKTVRLPKKTDVVDVYNRRLVAKGVDTFAFDAPLFSSWLFYCADDAESLLDDL